MNPSIRKAFPITLFALAAVLPISSWAQASLDGKAFVAEAGEKGKAADEHEDLITFASGTFHSSACDKYGFTKSSYSSADGRSFDAETTSEKDGRIVWKGTVNGDTIEGTFVHHPKGWLLNPNPIPVEHWFKGKVKG